ncbi:MAG: hypothetical protein C0P79_002290 [Gammaproteobacteria bacterium]
MSQRFLIAAFAAAMLAACTEEPSTSPSVDSTAEPSASPSAQPAAEPAAPAPAAQSAGAGDIPDRIVIERQGVIPEGIEYDQTNRRFLVGSLGEGTVFEVGLDGRLTPFVTDDELVSSVGIEVDEERNRLLVCNSDRNVFGGSATGHAKLGIYALDSGERISMIDLGAALGDSPEGAFFANDVAVGADGTAYVTDTRQNLVYRVGNDGVPSVLHRFDGDAGPNGIVYHDGGYLLVVGLTSQALYKIPVDNPDAAAEVTLPEPLAGGDGMVWAPDGRLAVVSNSTSRVILLSSDDDWATAEIAGIGTFEGQGTTAAVVGDDIFVVKPQFQDQAPPEIERVSIQ